MALYDLTHLSDIYSKCTLSTSVPVIESTIPEADRDISITKVDLLVQDNIIDNNIYYINGVDYDKYISSGIATQIQSKTQKNGLITILQSLNGLPAIDEHPLKNNKKNSSIGCKKLGE